MTYETIPPAGDAPERALPEEQILVLCERIDRDVRKLGLLEVALAFDDITGMTDPAFSSAFAEAYQQYAEAADKAGRRRAAQGGHSREA